VEKRREDAMWAGARQRQQELKETMSPAAYAQHVAEREQNHQTDPHGIFAGMHRKREADNAARAHAASRHQANRDRMHDANMRRLAETGDSDLYGPDGFVPNAATCNPLRQPCMTAQQENRLAYEAMRDRIRQEIEAMSPEQRAHSEAEKARYFAEHVDKDPRGFRDRFRRQQEAEAADRQAVQRRNEASGLRHWQAYEERQRRLAQSGDTPSPR
jgi:hypothetical protein